MAVNRKPVHLVKGKTGRDYLWEQVRRLKNFTVPEIVNATSMHKSSVREFIHSLVKAGYIEKTYPAAKFEAARYQLVKPVATTPRVRKDGSEVTQGRGQENMWRAMRLLKEFTAREIAATASAGGVEVSFSTAQSYCCKLCKAGYLRVENGHYKFISAKYTGPLPPMIQRNKQIYDPNLKKVVWPQKDN